MGENWDKYAAEWDTDEDVIWYSKKAYNALSKVLKLEGLNVLDFGCGTGRLTERMSPIVSRVLAIDSSEKMISVLENKQLKNVETLAVELSKESIRANDLLHSKFDLIVASSVCAFLPDYESTLLLLKGLLKPNGIFVQWDWLKSNENSTTGFTKEMIESAFSKSGLKVLSITEAFTMDSNEALMKVLMGVGGNA